MRIFSPKLFSTLQDYNASKFVRDLVAGIIVAIIALPLSIALAIASGVSPERGLLTATVAGFVISFLGGSRVNISGPTAAFATIVAGIVAQFGLPGLVLATIMAGIILIAMGILNFGVLIKFIPYTITTGFTAGIAVTIAIGQLKDFMGLSFAEGTHAVETMEKLKAVIDSIATINFHAVLVGLIGLAVLILWPKINKRIPGSLIAVVVGILLCKCLPLHVNTIGDLYSISHITLQPALPSFDLKLIGDLLPSAFTIAVLAAIESLLSCVVSDGMIDDKHNSNTELIAQGIGNICSGLFGGIPATGAIARTAANVNNGGRSPVAGMIHAVILLAILLFLMPYAAWIPMPIIAAILFMVAYNMCQWRQFRQICKVAPKSDIAVLVLTFVLTVVFDLVIAIEIGLLTAFILFIKRMTDVTHVRAWVKDDEVISSILSRHKSIPPQTQVYDIDGPLFFATSEKFSAIPIKDGTRIVILRMRNIPALDYSALRTIQQVYDHCTALNITVLFSHVNEQPMHVMLRSGFFGHVGKEHFLDNIDEALALADKLQRMYSAGCSDPIHATDFANLSAE